MSCSRALAQELSSDEESASRTFDRMWAQQLIRQARGLLQARAERSGSRAFKRWELLKLRFQDAQPIRDIARKWDVDAAHLHHEYATAREEFARALRDVVRYHQPHAPNGVDGECERLLSLLRG